MNLNSLLIKVKVQSNTHIPVVWINVLAVALSVSTMILSSLFINGFEHEVNAKVYDFWANIHILPYSITNSQLEKPIKVDNSAIASLQLNPDIKSTIKVANKGVVLKTKNQIEGVILKGVDSLRWHQYLSIVNHKPAPIDSHLIPIIISESLRLKLDIDTSKPIYISYIQEEQFTRPATVVGLFRSGIAEYDQQTVICQLQDVQRLNGWVKDELSSIEIFVKDENKINQIAANLYNSIPDVNVVPIQQIFPQLFDWLRLMKQNELIIFIIMLVVASINIISTLSIFILEQSPTIGVLKILGMSNTRLYRVYYAKLIKFVLLGMLFGNIAALLLGMIQKYLKPIQLDPSVYYVDAAPIAFDLYLWLIINGLTLVVCMITLWVPISIITRISPIKVAEYR